MNLNGSSVIDFALKFKGRKYVLGVFVPKDQDNYAGSFDCAEFVAYCNYQVFTKLYGCDTDNIANAHKADAYTGYFAKDAKALGTIISVAEAVQTRGAMLLRLPAPGADGHIIFSQGNGKSIEANGKQYGCGEFNITGRRFDYGILLPGCDYQINTDIKSVAPVVVYRWKSPVMTDPFIGRLQKALGIAQDNEFGSETHFSVVSYQKAHGLIPDGEVMPNGETAKSLGL